MISQTVEYSLRAMVTLASYYDDVMTVREIAAITKVPRPYLSKMMRELVRAGLVHSRRGLRGGFRLAHPPEDISIMDVMDAIDPIQRLRPCPLIIQGHVNPCALHRAMDQVVDQIEQAYRGVSLADILSQCGEARPCEFSRCPPTAPTES